MTHPLVTKSLFLLFALAFAPAGGLAADNALTEAEKKDGWVLLFDGDSLSGWMTSSQKPSQRPVDEHAINPHGSGGYMMIHEKPWSDFTLALDFKIAKGCNSGVFVRTSPLEPRRQGGRSEHTMITI